MSKCQHTDFRKGQKVMLIMRNGEKLVDRYVEKKSGAVIMRDSGRINLSTVRQIVIYRVSNNA